MSITIRYFASLKDFLGQSEQVLVMDNALSVADVWRLATQNKPMPTNLLAAVNREYVDFDCLVNAGDEVAFFPPVTGG